MFNIKIQCCALILLVVLHLLFRPYRKLNTLPNRVFQVTYYIILAGLIADILSVFLITYQDRLPKILVEVEAKTYLISLELTALLGLLYLISSVTSKMEKIRKWIRINFGVAAFFVILIYVLPIHLVGENNGEIVYSSGPSALATYISAAYFSIFVVLALVTKRKLLPTRQHRAILMWFCLWMVASIIQFFNPELLLVGYAGALGIIIIFFQSENPELYLDRYTGLFNSMGFFRYMDENYNANQKLSVISIRFEQTMGHEHSSDYSNNIVTSAANQFLSLRSAKVFKMLEDEVLMIFRDAEEARRILELLKRDLPVKMTIRNIVTVVFVEDTRYVKSSQELLDLITYARASKTDLSTRNFITADESLTQRMFAEKLMNQQIQEAIAEDRIKVFYQPIFSICENRFVSAEALVRIEDENGKIISPVDFIPIAEKNGLIMDIGRRVFEKVCHFFVDKKLESFGIQYIEVNLSVIQCADEFLAHEYGRIMEKFRIKPSCINLEITESASLHAKQILIKNMQQLLDYGTSFSLDDFGTGNSNLNYIVDMPVQIVKFDRSMIQSYFTSQKAKYVMDAAMQMIHGMELAIVAEGIETEEQYNAMKEIKISYIQGYYFSKPLPEEEFLDFLREKQPA
ncbi:MAG: EAL domain-containing protein [Hallerella sp.]|uniref:EAL domain-containing protein n=1 Tax=Hallerella sp. TaxID=2815812 RepID=UPI00259095A5|nr:EAL domain-containing protein [Hallerella sp.]MCI5601205.1 EAL domain-containing protein [Hallerella sp.]